MILERTQAGKKIAKQEFESGQSIYADIDNKYGSSKSTLYCAMQKKKATFSIDTNDFKVFY